jgi:hypothetical protein
MAAEVYQISDKLPVAAALAFLKVLMVIFAVWLLVDPLGESMP